MRPERQRQKTAFTLLELLVVIAIIGLLAGLLLPVLRQAQDKARMARCSSNLRQIYSGLMMYLPDYNEVVFWTSANLSLYGMDWYVYGGRETGNANLGQGGLFNNTVPRPLNAYTRHKAELYQCPTDTKPLSWAGQTTHFDWVGNSYNYNANGSPLPPLQGVGGFNQIIFSGTRAPAATVLFFDASLLKSPDSWHFRTYGNVAFADGHVEFIGWPSSSSDSPYTWIP